MVRKRNLGIRTLTLLKKEEYRLVEYEFSSSLPIYNRALE